MCLDHGTSRKATLKNENIISAMGNLYSNSRAPAVVKKSFLASMLGGVSPSKVIMAIVIIIVILIREIPKLVIRFFLKPPSDYLSRYLAQILKLDEIAKKTDGDKDGNETTGDGKTVMINFGMKSGSVRRQLVLNTVSSAINYSNYVSLTKFGNGDKIALSKEEREYFPKFMKNCAEVDCKNKFIVGIFHPYCNAGGGGEKVLWKLVADLQATLPATAKIVIYTGDLDIGPVDIIDKVNLKFNYNIKTENLTFIYLTKRKYVDGKYWKRFTLLAQALSSIVLAVEAIHKLPPDCFIDTMGYPFVYPVVKHLLQLPVISYTHYPVIQQDMLNTVDNSFVKKWYWKLMMMWYKRVSSSVDFSITNSTWTNSHMDQIWPLKNNTIIYPPCFEASSVTIKSKIESYEEYAKVKKFQCVLVAQFRPEKRHRLAITKYAEYYKKQSALAGTRILKVIFIGSTRTQEDADYVDFLREYAFETLQIPASCMEFQCNLSFEALQASLQESMFGLNCMWNEHFGISVVEYMASGCVPLVHASAGPLLDIVVNNYKNGVFFTDEEDPDYVTRPDKKDTEYLSLKDVFAYVSSQSRLESFHAMALENVDIVINKFSDEKFDQDFNTKVLPHLKSLIFESKDARFKEDEELA